MESLNFFTHAVGRYVTGDMTNLRTKDQDNRPIPPDDQRYEFGVAFAKNEIWTLLAGPGTQDQPAFYEYLSQALYGDANGLQRMQQWFQQPGGKGIFSMKIADGDLPNSQGRVNENTKGCFVFYFSALGFKTVNGSNQEIDVTDIKRGYYVQVAGNIKPNKQPGDRAGIYLNCSVVRLVAEGDVIVGGVDAETAFGGTVAPTQLPPGARPLGSSAGVAPPAPGYGMSAPAPAAAPMPAPNAPYAPAPAPTGHAVAPGQAPSATPPTASPGNPPAPYPGVMNPPLPGA